MDNICFNSASAAVEDHNARIVAGGMEREYSYTAVNSNSGADVYTLAKAFLFLSSMTNKKLQKLCYYAKAWYLALYDENLIEEPFQAWVHGAVQPSLYRKYKGYGFEKIPKLNSSQGIPEEFLDFARDVYDAYGDLSGDELEALNHTEDPWIKAREGYKPWENCNVVISEEEMKIYYRKMMS